MKDYVILAKVTYFYLLRRNSESDEKSLNLHQIGEKQFLYFSLYYEVVKDTEDEVVLRFYSKGGNAQREKWTVCKEDVSIKPLEKKAINFKLDRKNTATIELICRNAEEYNQELRAKREFESLPLVEKLRRKGAKELEGYALRFKETFSAKDVYSEEEKENTSEFDVIEGNRCASYYLSYHSFEIKKIVSPNSILLGDCVIEEGKSVVVWNKTEGGYTNDGPSYQSLKIEATLIKK